VADCEWAILCDYAFLDLNRKTCMIGTFDKVFTPSVPSVLHHAALAVKFSGAAGESVNFRVQILRPQPISAELAAFEGSVQLVETGTAEMQFNIAGLPLPDYGAYAFNIYSGQALLKVITFVVDRPPQPVQQAPQ
jgi:hypothetical protein